MAIYKSGNPALSKKTFQKLEKVADASESMTISGTVNKVALLLLLVIVSSMLTWNYFMNTMNVQMTNTITIGGFIAGLALILILRKIGQSRK